MSLLEASQQMTFLEGKNIRLRPLAEEDAEGRYPAWLNDQTVCAANTHAVYPYSRNQALEYIRGTYVRQDALVLAIVIKESGRHVGNVSLQHIDFIARSVELAIVLGEKDCWGKGIGYEACELLVRHAFLALNMERVYLGTPSSNLAMLKLAKKLGMQKEGCRRNSFYKNGSYHDLLEFGLLRNEFISRVQKEVFCCS